MVHTDFLLVLGDLCARHGFSISASETCMNMSYRVSLTRGYVKANEIIFCRKTCLTIGVR